MAVHFNIEMNAKWIWREEKGKYIVLYIFFKKKEKKKNLPQSWQIFAFGSHISDQKLQFCTEDALLIYSLIYSIY